MSAPPPPPPTSPTKLRRATSDQHEHKLFRRTDTEFKYIIPSMITITEDGKEVVEDPMKDVEAIKERSILEKLDTLQEAINTLQRIQELEAMDTASPNYHKDRHARSIGHLWSHLHLLTCEVLYVRMDSPNY